MTERWRAGCYLLPDGATVERESNYTVPGLVLGALVDAALIFAASQALDDDCSMFTYGPGEGMTPSC